MKNEKLGTKTVMFDFVTLKEFDKLVGKQNRSATIRDLIDFYIKSPNFLKEEK